MGPHCTEAEMKAHADGIADNMLSVTVMRKETFIIHAENDISRDQIVKDLLDCVDFAVNCTSPSEAQRRGKELIV